MIQRFIELSLLALTLTGLYLVWQTGQERAAARAEYERLSRLTGDLPLTDPNKVHVLALETGESLHFAWRVYLPPNRHFTARYHGGASSSLQATPQQFIARVRFREQPAGRMQIYTKFAGGSGQMGFGDESLAAFLRGRWDQVQVEQLGSGKMAVLKPDEEAVLLRLTLPEDLRDQAASDVDARRLQARLPLLFEMRIAQKPLVP
jgi:hypothetical protein